MLNASSRTNTDLYSANPITQIAVAPLTGAAQENPERNVQLAGLLAPPFVYSQAASKLFEDCFLHAKVPEDAYMQSAIAIRYLKNNDPGGLSEFLRKGQIQSLNFRARRLGVECAKVLASVLKNDKNLHHIDLQDSRLGSEGLKVICEALEENSALISLELGFNDPESLVHVEAIAQLMANNKTMEVLRLQFSNIGEEGMPVLAKALRQNQTLTELDLTCNYCGPKSGEALLEMLCENYSLKTVNLSGNEIGPDSGNLIAAVLNTNKTLREMNLDSNHLRSNDVLPVFNVLSKNATLQTLSLAHNYLDETSAGSIAFLLQENNTLSSLDLRGNKLFVPSDAADTDPFTVFVQGLENNTTLVDLKLQGNHPIDQSIVGRPAMVGGGSQQRNEDMARADGILERNRTFAALVEKDAGLCTELFPGQLLSLDEGKVLAAAMIKAAPNIAAYEATMFQVQCALNVLASRT
jgi:Ran GTPase-activating protein (RanGAP) involved in mRNA processing and transport